MARPHWAVARGMPTDGQVVGAIKHDTVRDASTSISTTHDAVTCT
ncbi:hypothetical protein ACFYXD_09080 [Streptomyces platensis]